MLAGSTNLANGFSFVAIVCEDPGLGRNAWRYVGSDYFNYNFTEETWKQYCEQHKQMRIKQSKQSRIRSYESHRDRPEHAVNAQMLDPDLPPELAGAILATQKKPGGTFAPPALARPPPQGRVQQKGIALAVSASEIHF